MTNNIHRNASLNFEIQSAFSALHCLNAPLFLNAYHAGLLNLPTHIKKAHTRLVFICNGVTEAKLTQHGFVKDRHLNEHYTRLQHDKLITLHRIIPKPEWLFDYVSQTQAYTLTSVFVDEHGQLHDGSNHGQAYDRGIADAALGVLRPLKDPIAMLAHQPQALLTTLDRLMDGYEPSTTLEVALTYWQADNLSEANETRAGIYSRCLQWQNTPALSQYAALLQRFGLLEKLFDLPNHEGINELTNSLVDRQPRPTHLGLFRLVANTRHDTQTHQLRNPHG